MAIRRCPYCKAIIDEGLEYCSNCGTQLIFPEDEFVDEEIPGEKIVDVNEEKSEPEEEELSKNSEDLASALEDVEPEKTEELREELEKDEVKAENDGLSEKNDLDAESSEMAEGEDLDVEATDMGNEEKLAPDEESDEIPDTEETFVETGELEEEPEKEIESQESEERIAELEDVDKEILSEKEAELKKPEATKKEEPQKDDEFADEQMPDDLEEPVDVTTPDSEEISQVEDVFAGVEEETGEISAENESIDFKTEDLEKIVDPAEKEKEEIEQFLNSLKEEREKTKKYYEETGELPPWAQSMKEGAISSLASDEEMGVDEDTIPSERAKLPKEEEFKEGEKLIEEEAPAAAEASAPADTGMGLPEGIDQQGLPFSRGFREEDTEEESRPHFRQKNMNLPSWIKSRVFDVVMITVLWLVTLWLASVVTKVTIFRLIAASPIPILGFLAILLTVYFFLFFFFLGETLGDQLFSQEE